MGLTAEDPDTPGNELVGSSLGGQYDLADESAS